MSRIRLPCHLPDCLPLPCLLSDVHLNDWASQTDLTPVDDAVQEQTTEVSGWVTTKPWLTRKLGASAVLPAS